MKDYKYAVYIGRFQPLHNGHLEVIKKGLEIADRVIVIVGSINAAPSIKNPWSFEERKTMISESLFRTTDGTLSFYSGTDHRPTMSNVKIVGVRDYHYNENSWIAEVQSKTSEFISEGDSIVLIGSYKDESSYYLKHFAQWDFVPVSTLHDSDGTTIRSSLFFNEFNPDWEGKCPENKRAFVQAEINHYDIPTPVQDFLFKFVGTPAYADLCKEFTFLWRYKASWKDAPFPPVFVTVDAVVTCSGHVLVVERGMNPGKGLYALPGGFIKQNERVERAMIRELKEETGIRVDNLILESSVVNSKVFDYPGRSLRGRTISHGFHLQLQDGKLPEVKGGDDAARAFWMPIMDVAKKERSFFDDHSHIITYFLHS